MRQDYCSWWFEGNWWHCCAEHDLSKLDMAAHFDLANCVAATGNPSMAWVMLLGVVFGGPFYHLVQKIRRK